MWTCWCYEVNDVRDYLPPYCTVNFGRMDIALNETAMALDIDLARDPVYLLIYLPKDIP